MIKHDYGHLNSPYYEEKLPNGLTVIFLPKKSKVKSATLYIGQGGFLHAKEIADSKIPFGSAYYLMNMLLPASLEEEFASEGVLASKDMDYSFVRYNFNTLGDIYAPIKKMLARMSSLDSYSEKDIDAFKETENRKEDSDPVVLSQKTCLENLYFTSPIRFGYLPSKADGVRIHATALKKYQSMYYTPEYMVLFLSMDDEMEHVISELKDVRLATNSDIREVKLDYQEIYNEVKKEYQKIKMDTSEFYLTYGIKLASRSILYDAYGEMTFAFYEVLLRSITTGNRYFMDNLANLQAELVDSIFKEGGEDSYILLTFRYVDEVALVHFLTEYFSKLDDRVSSSQFKSLTQEAYALASKDLSCPDKAVDLFSRSYPNHLSYTFLMQRVSHLNYNTYRRFLEDFRYYKKAVCSIVKG